VLQALQDAHPTIHALVPAEPEPAMSKPIAIAIDGPASSGKGTVARIVAHTLGYAYVDTGAMYRTVALLAREAGIAWTDGPALGRLAAAIDFRFSWDGDVLRVAVGDRDVSEAIREAEIGMGASDVAVLPEVRAALLGTQQALGRGGAVVMDGRDIGTVVMPGADLKVYLDASPSERARRRHLEHAAKGQDLPYDAVLAEIVERDRQDSSRATAPLVVAADAVVIDSTHLDAEQVALRVLREASRAAGGS